MSDKRWVLIPVLAFVITTAATILITPRLSGPPAGWDLIPEDPVLPTENYPDNAILPVPFFTQDNTGCSRSAFAMVMHYYDSSITWAMVTQSAARSSDNGSPNGLLVALAENWGFETRAYPGSIGDIIRNISHGKPVVVAQYPEITDTKWNHGRVAVGFDQSAEEIIVHDSARGENLAYSYDNFLALWEADFVFKSGGGVGDEKYYSVLVYLENAGGPESRTMTVDGYAPDWLGMTSFSPDRDDDCGAGHSKLNIKRMYVHRDNQYLYLMVVFADTPESDSGAWYYFDVFYSVGTTVHMNRLYFNSSNAPGMWIDNTSYVSLTDAQWALGTVFEARVGLQNFSDLPDCVSMRAGTYVESEEDIDQSYANAYLIR